VHFWAVTQRVAVIVYRRFRIAYRTLEITTTRCVIAHKFTVIVYFSAAAWNHANTNLSSITIVEYDIIYYWLFVLLMNHLVERRPSVRPSVRLRGHSHNARGFLWLGPVSRTRPSTRDFWRRKPQVSFGTESLMVQSEKGRTLGLTVVIRILVGACIFFSVTVLMAVRSSSYPWGCQGGQNCRTVQCRTYTSTFLHARPNGCVWMLPQLSNVFSGLVYLMTLYQPQNIIWLSFLTPWCACISEHLWSVNEGKSCECLSALMDPVHPATVSTAGSGAPHHCQRCCIWYIPLLSALLGPVHSTNFSAVVSGIHQR